MTIRLLFEHVFTKNFKLKILVNFRHSDFQKSNFAAYEAPSTHTGVGKEGRRAVTSLNFSEVSLI